MRHCNQREIRFEQTKKTYSTHLRCRDLNPNKKGNLKHVNEEKTNAVSDCSLQFFFIVIVVVSEDKSRIPSFFSFAL